MEVKGREYHLNGTENIFNKIREKNQFKEESVYQDIRSLQNTRQPRAAEEKSTHL